MRFQHSNFDWSAFWLVEIIFLSVPPLITVAFFRGGPSLSPQRAVVLAFVLIALTVLNVIAGTHRTSHANRFQKH